MADPLEPLEFMGMPAVVRSEAMEQLFELARRIALTNSPVLISGESGTGKELVARAIHHYSLRCTKPWVDINCASLPEHLIESELFGYERGAFSGAENAKQGLFEVASSGTLFLDEVGELEARTQVKLLRVLDGASYYRLGGVRKVNIDVRIVAATNKDLEQEIEAGRFRFDLYQRLTEVQLRVPPLRERPDDSVAIAEFFLSQQDGDFFFTPDAVDFIRRYHWPGNVREVRKVVMNAIIMARSREIRAADLRPTSFQPADREWNLDAMERRMISEALAATDGHQQRAADLLGISQRTLSRKLKRFRMENLSLAAPADEGAKKEA